MWIGFALEKFVELFRTVSSAWVPVALGKIWVFSGKLNGVPLAGVVGAEEDDEGAGQG